MDDIIEVILQRRSIRHFSEKDIPRELLEFIINAGLNAPNCKSVRLTIIERPSDIIYFKTTTNDVLTRLQTDSLHGFDNPKVIVIVSDLKTNPDAVINGGSAMESMMLTAYKLGLGTCWNNCLRTCQDDFEIRAKLLRPWKIPDSEMIIGCLLLGYPAIPLEKNKKPHRRENVIYYASEFKNTDL